MPIQPECSAPCKASDSIQAGHTNWSCSLTAPGTIENKSDLVHLDSAKPLGAATCFNRLIAHDDADVVVFLESGSIVTPEWWQRLWAALQADPAHGLAGPSPIGGDSTGVGKPSQRYHRRSQAVLLG